MRRSILVLCVGICLVGFVAGCSKFSKVKHWGETTSIDLWPDRKLVSVTWDHNDLWYLTRAMRPEEMPQSYYFHHVASNGALQMGTVLLFESRSPATPTPVACPTPTADGEKTQD